MPVEKKRKSTSRSKNRSSLPPVEEFEAIDFSSRGPDITRTATCGDVTISGFWSSENEIRLPNAVTIAVGGVFINRDEALVGDQKSYLHWLRDRVDHVFMDDIQADGGGQIYNSHKDAVEFSRRFTSLLMRHVRMSAPEFYQVQYELMPVTSTSYAYLEGHSHVHPLTRASAVTHTHTHTHTYTHMQTHTRNHNRMFSNAYREAHPQSLHLYLYLYLMYYLPLTLSNIPNTTCAGND